MIANETTLHWIIDQFENRANVGKVTTFIVVNIQMYAAVNKELCEKMMAELEGMLSTQFGMKNTLINVEKHKEPPPDNTVPLIVICINASRLGTDVNQAIHNIDRKYQIVQLQEIC